MTERFASVKHPHEVPSSLFSDDKSCTPTVPGHHGPAVKGHELKEREHRVGQGTKHSPESPSYLSQKEEPAGKY